MSYKYMSLTDLNNGKMDLSRIKRNIQTIGRSSDTLFGLVQDTALAIALHAKKHGDITPMSSLLRNMGAGLRRDALVVWSEKFFPVKVEAATADGPHTFTYNVAAKTVRLKEGWDKDTSLWNIEGAASTLWWNAKKESALRPLDFDAQLKTLLNTLNKRRSGEAEGGFKDSKYAGKISKLIGVPLAEAKPNQVTPANDPTPTPKARGKGKLAQAAA